ncbi:MAG: chromate transporter [Bacteroidales bacterium]|nr:chromate transporter [Bacteroidales bacterium]
MENSEVTKTNANSQADKKVGLPALFSSFCKIGAFTIGGGYAMIPLMEKELVDRHQWVDRETFMDVLSLSQAMPGVFAVNMASNIGYRLRGIAGTVTAVLGNILLPIVIIILWATCFKFLSGNPIFEAIFKGIRPAVVALIASPVFTMAMTANLNWRNAWIPAIAALLIWLLGVSPILIIIAAGVGGFIYGKYLERKGESL